MKHNLLSVLSLLFVTSLTAQISIVNSELTIQSGDTVFLRTAPKLQAAPERGDSKVWDYTNIGFSIPYPSTSFFADTNAVFPTASFHADQFISVANFSFLSKAYYEKSNQIFGAVGRITKRMPIDLLFVTGSSNDSLIISADTTIYASPFVLYDFPVEANKTWANYVTNTIPFELKLPSFFIPYSPCEVLRKRVQIDSIVGWGLLKILDPKKSTDTLEIPVLLNKRTMMEIDSVFLGGFPAPPALLAAFSITQGDTTKETSYFFLAENMSSPALLLVDYDYMPTDSFRLSAVDSIPDAALGQTGTKPMVQSVNNWNLYPNPVVGGKFSIAFEKPTAETCLFAIYTTSGQQVFSRVINAPKGYFQQAFEVNQSLPKGNYFYKLQDKNGKILVGGVCQMQ